VIVERLRLNNRTVIVAGAGGGGIGPQTCRAVLEAGGSVVAVDVSREALEALAGEGLDVTPVVADVRTADGVAAVLGTAAASSEPLHGLVNVIGGNLLEQWAPALDITRVQWDDVVDRNLRYAAFLSQAVARELVDAETGGAIVHIASTGGIAVAPYHVAYGAAKAGLLGLMRTQAVEWGRYGIRVNAVAPGTIMTARAGATEDPAKAARALPLRRRGRPEEVAGAVLFLLSDLGSYVTGACLPVDGGASQKLALFDEDDVPIFVSNPQVLARIKPDR
jgi:3-oxoacyl-[acyl-carrier protein] reductase